MWVVVDEYHNKVYGPFASQEDGEEWLAAQGIQVDLYEEQEVGLYQLSPINEKLGNINDQ